MSDEIQSFRIEVAEEELDDLRLRLRRTRWPERETVDDWSQGVPLTYLEDLCRYWADEYDWRAAERRLNELPQFRTMIGDVGIHFLHLRSPHPDALPLVVTHGWPGSIIEFLKVIGPLADPPRSGGDTQDAFHVVCPSLPGYGFSDKPSTPGWGVERIADAWATLMARLGYDQYGAQGSDWGTSISTCLAQQHPEHVVGIHLTPPLACECRKLRRGRAGVVRFESGG
jgi:epoxide hydrolase